MAAIKIQAAFKRFKARKERERKAKLEAEIKAKQAAVFMAKQEAMRAKEITAKPHPKEPLIKVKPADAPRRRQRHDSKQQTPMSQLDGKSKSEQEMKIKREAVAYFGNLVPEKGLPVSKKPHVPSPLVTGESRPVKSTVNAKKKQTVPTDDLPDLKDEDVQNAAV